MTDTHQTEQYGELLYDLDLVRPRLRNRVEEVLRELPRDWNKDKYVFTLRGKTKNLGDIRMLLIAAKKVLDTNIKYDRSISKRLQIYAEAAENVAS